MTLLLSLPWNLADRNFADAITRVNAANPFLPERIAAERVALGASFLETNADWNMRRPTRQSHPNLSSIAQRCGALLEQARAAWPKGGGVTREDAALYEEVAGYWFFQQYAPRFDKVILASLAGRGEEGRVAFYPAFRVEVERYLSLPGLSMLEVQTAPHLFACAFQIRRAFHNIFNTLVGSSAPMARLRRSAARTRRRNW